MPHSKLHGVIAGIADGLTKLCGIRGEHVRSTAEPGWGLLPEKALPKSPGGGLWSSKDPRLGYGWGAAGYRHDSGATPSESKAWYGLLSA